MAAYEKSNIYNYNFNWEPKTADGFHGDVKEKCCKKYKKKKEVKCKNCPKLTT